MSDEWFATHAAGFGPVAARLAARDLPGASVEFDGDNAIRVSLEGDGRGGADGRAGGREGPGSGRGDGRQGAPPLVLLSYCRGLFRFLGEAGGGLESAARAFARGAFDADALGAGSGEARYSAHPVARPGDGRRDGRHSARPGGGRAPDSRGSGGRNDGRFSGAPASGRGTFVLRAFGPDDPASLALALKRELEGIVSRATGLRPDSTRPDREYRLQERGDGRVLFLEKMKSVQEATPRPGELPRTTCRLLAEMTEPRPEDVFLDPFCGYGGIALERAIAASYRFVFAQALDPDKVAAVKESLSAKAFEKRRKTFFPKARDALDPAAFEPGFVTAIATDPPWGLYEGGGTDSAGAEVLLGSFLTEAARLLAPGGRLVLLVSRQAAEHFFGGDGARAGLGARSSAFALGERLDVLVSGKKASVLRLDRA
jgi:SAM-dependent methyltransferase